MPTKPKLALSGDPAADKLISQNAFALLVGMVLDQQIPLEWAFTAPSLLAARVSGPLDAATIAGMDPETLADAFRQRPALHRFPGSMAARVQEMAKIVVAEYGGDAGRIWKTATSGEELLRRIEALPGFGKQKAKIFVALLGKQLRVQPPGWREQSAPFGEDGSHLSIADIDSPDTLALVREHKRQMKAAVKATTAAKVAKATRAGEASKTAKAGKAAKAAKAAKPAKPATPKKPATPTKTAKAASTVKAASAGRASKTAKATKAAKAAKA